MKDKKRILLILAIIAIFIGIIVCSFIIMNSNKKSDNPNVNNPGGTTQNPGGNNQGENNQGGSNQGGNNQGGNTTNPDGNGGNSSGPGGNGTNGGNQNGSQGSSSTSAKYYNLSCKRTLTEVGTEMLDSLSLKYDKAKGLQSDEVIITLKSASGGTKEQLDNKKAEYQYWFDRLNKINGVSITIKELDDKTIYNIKTDYTKLDESALDYTEGDGVHPYNYLKKDDEIDFITAVLVGSGYDCQKVG